MQPFVFLLVVGSAIWVGVDASKLGFQRGRLGGGMLDMGVASYVLATLLIWIIGFPCYLVARGKYQAMRNAAPSSYGITPAAYGGAAVAPGFAATAMAPPQASPDGQWWWDGHQWTPAIAPGSQLPPS